jgi:hypothetical protein
MDNSIEESKKRKVKAWCQECYQFFQNSPFTKICRDHILKGKCNLIECKKKQTYQCIRKFTNTNSENRHTHCISLEEAKKWDERCMIQNCLGHKRVGDIDNMNYNNKQKKCKDSVISEISIKSINEEELNKLVNFQLNEKNEQYDIQYPSNNLFGIIDKISNLKFTDNEFSFDDDFINDFNKIYFTPPLDKKRIRFIVKKEDNNYLNDNDDIDKLYEVLYKKKLYSKNILNKLKSILKEKNILAIKDIRDFKKNDDMYKEIKSEYKPQIDEILNLIDKLIYNK